MADHKKRGKSKPVKEDPEFYNDQLGENEYEEYEEFEEYEEYERDKRWR